MRQKAGWLVVGLVVGAGVGVASGYLVAGAIAKRGENPKYPAVTASMPKDAKAAWENYVQAQRAYMAAVKQVRKVEGGELRVEGGRPASPAQPRGQTASNAQRSALNPQPSSANPQPSTLNGAIKGGTLIAFDETVVDFGTVDQGTESTSVFLYRNKGRQTLKILDTTTSCGCTVAEPQPREVPPGGVGILKVSFKSGSFSGPISKTITVRSNDPAAPAVTLAVKANVRTLFVLEPKVVKFGDVERGKVARQEVALKPATPETFVVQRLTTTHAELNAELLAGKGAGGGGHRIGLTLDPKGNYGPFAFAARVYLARPPSVGKAGQAGPLEFTIPVTGTVAGPVRVTPESVFLGSVRQGELFKPQKVVLSSRTGKPVEIRSVDTGFAGLKAEVKPLKPGLEYEVALNAVTPPPAGFFQHTMRVTTSESNVPVEVKLTGVVMKAATTLQ